MSDISRNLKSNFFSATGKHYDLYAHEKLFLVYSLNKSDTQGTGSGAPMYVIKDTTIPSSNKVKKLIHGIY